MDAPHSQRFQPGYIELAGALIIIAPLVFGPGLDNQARYQLLCGCVYRSRLVFFDFAKTWLWSAWYADVHQPVLCDDIPDTEQTFRCRLF